MHDHVICYLLNIRQRLPDKIKAKKRITFIYVTAESGTSGLIKKRKERKEMKTGEK
jgi:hypothetical protein